MVTEEEIGVLRRGFMSKYREWGKAHPDWTENKYWEFVKSKLNSDRNRTVYDEYGIKFFSYIDEEPDQVFERKKKQVSDNDPIIREHYETKIKNYKDYLVDLHYRDQTIKGYLKVVTGFFDKIGLGLTLPKGFWDVRVSEYVRDHKETKRYPLLEEIKSIYHASDQRGKIAILLGCQNGLTNSDTVKITWDKLNLNWDGVDFYTDFYVVDHKRVKTDVSGKMVLGPDMLYNLKQLWLQNDKPNSGYVLNYRGNKLKAYVMNDWFNESAVKALGPKRAKEITFTDLRDFYNNVIKSKKEIKQEIADLLMGHKPAGSRGEYYVSDQTIIDHYRIIYDELSVNSWKFKAKVEGLDELNKEVEGMRMTIGYQEKEIISMKTRNAVIQQMYIDINKKVNVMANYIMTENERAAMESALDETEETDLQDLEEQARLTSLMKKGKLGSREKKSN
ncbi:hypothetical protein KKF32_05365 [Patescibacteria group bacterium]|nr:hypothetical protein [Patescibacteria group bacterium]